MSDAFGRAGSAPRLVTMRTPTSWSGGPIWPRCGTRSRAGTCGRPTELALLHKAHHDRPRDRADLAAARLDPAARRWLAETLEMLGHHDRARLTAR